MIAQVRSFLSKLVAGDLPRATAATGALIVGSRVLGLALSIVLARALGPADYGVFAVVLSLANFATLPMRAGMPTLLERETSRAGTRGTWASANGLLRWGLRNSLIAACVVQLLALPVIFSSAVEPAMINAYLLVVPVALGTALLGILAAPVRGFGRVALSIVPDLVLRPALALLALLAVAAITWAPPLDATGVLSIHLGSLAVSCFAAWAIYRHLLPDAARSAVPTRDTPVWWRSIRWLALIAGVQMVNTNADLVLLGSLSTEEEAGIYRIASQFSVFVTFGLGVVSSVVAPRYASLHASGKMAELASLARRSSLASLVMAVPVAGLLAIVGPTVLARTTGPAFAASYVPLMILCVAQLVSAAAGPAEQLLNMTGHERDTLLGVFLSAIANLLLNALLIPRYGATGAAIGTALSVGVWNGFLVYAARNRLGIRPLSQHPPVDQI